MDPRLTLAVADVVDLPDHAERAWRICQAFETTQRVMWSSMWPWGHCAVSSLLLAPMLRAGIGREYRVVIGWVRETPTHRHGVHAWVADEEDYKYDPTYGQFLKSGFPTKLATLGIYLAGDPAPHVAHNTLTLDGEEEMRRSITPTEGDGWSAASHVRYYFHAVGMEMERNEGVKY